MVKIITIDILAHAGRPQHPRIKYVQGASADPDLIGSLLNRRSPEKCMVILDSDHSKQHILAEINLLAPYVSVGSYLVSKIRISMGIQLILRLGKAGLKL
jgi:cephalosporin hydroxylase